MVMALIAFRFDSPARDSPAGRLQLCRPGPCSAPLSLPADGAREDEEEEEEERSRPGMGFFLFILAKPSSSCLSR